MYAFGMMGWSIMINLISVLLVYFYEPPANSGLPLVISQAVIFGIFNIISLVTASGRLEDAAVDPMIAQLSERSKHPKGRRIPFMRVAILPSFVFCCLVFHPLKHTQSPLNMVWLIFMLAGFYVSSTTFVIPYNALLPELAPRSKDKVQLATWQSVGYVLGIAVASNAFNLTDFLQHSLGIASRVSALQYTVILLALPAAVCMGLSTWGIDEKKWASGKPKAVSLGKALRQSLSNRNFLFFIVADFSYFIAVTIITSGLLYFVTVLLHCPRPSAISLWSP